MKKIAAFGDYYKNGWPELTQLVPEDALRVLVVGCGTGLVGIALKSAHARREVVGIEQDPMAAELAEQRLDKVFVGHIEHTDLFYTEGYFDCILYPDILHRVSDPWKVLRKYRRLLAPGGCFLARIPNLQNIQNLKNFLHGCSDQNGGVAKNIDVTIPDRDHLHAFTREDTSQLFSEVGFEAEFVSFEPDSAFEQLQEHPGCKKLVLGRATFDLRGLQKDQMINLFSSHFIVRAFPRPEPQKKRTVSIIIPMCNQLEYTHQCLESLLTHTSGLHELILVNNGSNDATAEYLKSLLNAWSGGEVNNEKEQSRSTSDAEFEVEDKGVETESESHESLVKNLKLKIPGATLRLISNTKNIGFPAAVNQGIRAATGEYVLVLNNDTVLTKGWMDGLLRCAESLPDAGIVGPMSNVVALPQKDPKALYEGAQGLSEYAEYVSREREDQWLEVQEVSGLCMLIKRQVFEKIGVFDECFSYGTFEDHDLCQRARKAGFRVFVATDVFIHHFSFQTFGELDLNYSKLLEENRQKFQEKSKNGSLNGSVNQTLLPESSNGSAHGDSPSNGRLSIIRDDSSNTSDQPSIEKYESLRLAFLEKGREEVQNGKFSEALETFEKAVEYTPESSEIYGEHGWVCFQKGLYEQAKESWLKSVALDSTNHASKRNLADFYFSQEQFSNAVSWYESLVANNVADMEVVNALGDAYAEIHNYKGAATAYEFLAKSLSSNSTEASKEAVQQTIQKLEMARQHMNECLTV